MHQKTRAIILKKTVYGESDLIVTFFGRDDGRMTGIAKSARASQRRFGGALELGSLANLHYVIRRGADLVRIEDSQVYLPTTGIMNTLRRIGALSRALELALAFLPERQAAPEKFDLLANYIFQLSCEDPRLEDVIAFELKWLKLAGYSPMLESCINCQDSIEDGQKWVFLLDLGGILCPTCAKGRPKKIEISHGAVKGMRELAMGKKLVLEKNEIEVAERFVAAYVEHLIGRSLYGRQVSKGW